MIQDIAPHSFSNKFVETGKMQPDDFVLCFRDSKLMMIHTDEEPLIPRFRDLPDIPSEPALFLFHIDQQPCFLVPDYAGTVPEKFSFEDLYFFRTYKHRELAWMALVGSQLHAWYLGNRFCGSCGTATTIKKTERAITCEKCGTTVYPKISPAVIVGITCRNKILLARGHQFRHNFYSLVAGYADIGESLEDAVRREVKEEVGIDVFNLRYYKSQPWPFSGSMMIGYWAEADDDQPIVPEEAEIASAGWFERGNLPAYPPDISIAGEMIALFEADKHQG